jgi:nicotinamidase/pyrazinamidase
MLREPTKTAIVIIDIQNDFMEGGALQVSGANFSSYLGACEEFRQLARGRSFVTAQSKDCHPPGHSSFASSHPGKKPFELATLTRKGKTYQQMMWPDHCVQGTKGVELVMPAVGDEIVQNKGGKLDVDSYSAFIDDAGEETGLGATLKAKGVTNVIIFGLATDYCVWFSCKDAKELGFNVAVIPELSRGVAAETAPGLALTAPPSGDDKVFSWAQYREKGVHILPLDVALRTLRP